MKSTNIEDKLAVNKYDIDEEIHIRILEDVCKNCHKQTCVYTCPADCFKLREEKITFSHEGCLECGTCLIICKEGAIDWALPRGGFGICYQYG